MRFHIPALPGQPISKENSQCAFTQKVRAFSEMMVPRGHEVFVYGQGDSEVIATEYIKVGELDDEMPGFTPSEWQPFCDSVLPHLQERAEPEDFLGITCGICQEHIRNNVSILSTEYGIGYAGVIRNTHKVFESYAWMHAIYGALYGADEADGRFYDSVIWPYKEVPEIQSNDNQMPYLLFVGRLIPRKGLQVVIDTAERVGLPVYIAGEGEFKIESSRAHYIGAIGAEQRNKMMRDAIAVMCPSLYIEPGCQVACEAQLMGTPVISTDWGVFTETVLHEETGYRCSTLSEFVQAVEDCENLDKDHIRKSAIERFSYEVSAPKFERYFENLGKLHQDGWYS